MVSNIDTRRCLRILTSGAGGCWPRPRREALGGVGSGTSPRSRELHVRPLAGVSGNSAGRRRRANPAGFAVPVAGARRETETQPELLNALEALVEPTARGDPGASVALDLEELPPLSEHLEGAGVFGFPLAGGVASRATRLHASGKREVTGGHESPRSRRSVRLYQRPGRGLPDRPAAGDFSGYQEERSGGRLQERRP